MGMYESPIKIIESTIDSFSKAIIKQKDDAIFAEIQSAFGVELDRSELIRALQYDRGQYEKGYADGKADAKVELVRCKDCKYYREGAIFTDTKFCFRLRGDNDKPVGYNFSEDDFCSRGERKDNE